MFKLITHAITLFVGASLGMWWGVNHPTAASNLVKEEEAKIAQAKVELLQQLKGNPTPDNINHTLDAETQHLQQVQQN
jgi:DNA-directed RNA polymerase specialized sigma subunit